MKKYSILALILLSMASCSSKTDSTVKVEDTDSVSTVDVIRNDTASIFGTVVHLDEVSALQELAEKGVLKCDTIMMEDGEFNGAIIEFAGVRFGMNKGFVFITSKQDKQAIDSLVNEISYYYGEPEIDDEGEPEWSSYHWSLSNTVPDRPYIRIRPLHSEDGGLAMTWSF